MELLTKLILVVFLLIFFYLLGKSANLIVINLKRLGNKLGLPMYFLGLILGLFTSLPEFIVGINSLLNGIENVAFGNLFGGTLVALALVLGINAVMNKSIKTNTHGGNFMAIMVYILLPILLSMDGLIGILDGSLLIVGYLLLIYRLYSSSKNDETTQLHHHNKKKLYLGIFWIVFGITGVVVLSTLIVNTTELLLVETGISQFALGLILFAIGTNLPEITIAIKSMQNHNKELSYSNILGSAAANPFLIGVLSFMQPLRFQIEIPYMLMAFFTFMLVIILYFFYKSDNKFTRKEGIILIWIYILFVFSELLSQIYIGGH